MDITEVWAAAEHADINSIFLTYFVLLFSITYPKMLRNYKMSC